MHEAASEHARERGEAQLRFLVTPLAWRLLVGAPFAAAWMRAVLVPLARHIESDVPTAMVAGAFFVAAITPLVLYLRRHALDAVVRWDDRTVTLVRGGRIETSIAWRDADVRVPAVASDHEQAIQISDPTGRSITLATQRVLSLASPTGRRGIARADLAALLRAARRHASVITADLGRSGRDPMPERGIGRALTLALVVSLPVALGAGRALGAIAFAVVCALLLVDPTRRLRAAFARPTGRETLVIDTEERGRMRARRLDGSRVLLDVSRASHPDAMLAARRGFVHAVLEVPAEGTGTTYRSQEEAIPATFVETRDDRVLRFEHLRAALVDVIGYGAYFATAVAALFVA